MDIHYDLKYYKKEQIMCQIYLGPPSWYKGQEPEHLTEIFISNLGRDINELEVFKLCHSFGVIYQIRLPVTFADSKGFAYCRFFHKQQAADAIAGLNDSLFRGRKIKASLSMDTRVIQIMGLPNWPLPYIKHYLEEKTKKATDIQINQKFKFALVKFASHNEAQVCIRELKKCSVFGRVQWARGDSDLPEEYFQTVTDLYVGHLPEGCTLTQLRRALSDVIDAVNIVKIHRSGCYGFIYFSTHAEAEKALLCLRASNITIGGQAITFNWLKGEYSKKRAEPAKSSSKLEENQKKLANDLLAQAVQKPDPFDPLFDLTFDFSELDYFNFNRAPGAERAGRRTQIASQDSGIGYSQSEPFFF